MADQPLDFSCSAVILAGGLNSRMGGLNKAFLKLNGKPILQWLLESLQQNFDDILLVTRQPELYQEWPVKVVTDIYTARSSLTGIHAGFVNAPSQYIFAIGCDTPFLRPELTQLLLDEVSADQDAVVPFYGGHFQPLCAVYAQRCLTVVEKQLNAKHYKIIDFFDQIRIKKITGAKLKQVDPQMTSFLNVNTPEMYQTCQAILQSDPS